MNPQIFLTIGIVCAIMVIVGGIWWWFSARQIQYSDTDMVLVQFSHGSIHAEIAASFLKHAAGLSAREAIALNDGMLFIFTKPQPLTFWMKGMRFPLDFIWLRDNTVVDTSSDIQPPKTIFDFGITRPKENADMVLEVNAGTINRLNIQIGDNIRIQKTN